MHYLVTIKINPAFYVYDIDVDYCKQLEMKIVEDEAEINALISLKGGPEGNLLWDPEPILPKISMNKSSPSSELSILILNTCFYMIITIILLGKIFIIYRKCYQFSNYLLRRFISMKTSTSLQLNNLNEMYIRQCSTDEIEYLEQSSEKYQDFIEDYKELLKLLNFIDEYSHE
ncbi:hypothetical protein EWB00_000246 [Schistosoma japonicum]|uniref:Uncharacterized protein n=1 Tax=Schistosoma japonicum TaxID=6182 RepID=A0A4Z2DJE0_SCHJA|nr:hypothetical protein EWB00_000246 [Schistosoma japonicum]